MGYEENKICNTTLTLSLQGSDVIPGYLNPRFDQQHENRKSSSLHLVQNKCHQPLTLGPIPGALELKFEVQEEDGISMGSSFTNSSLKRERDQLSGEEEVEKEDEEVLGTRKKLRLTKEQSVVLEDSFKDHTTLNSKQKELLARRLNLRPRQVEVWFQNRRARNKLKQTEVDCEVLRKCYDSLSNENQRLHKELQQLKANTPPRPPFYVQLSATATPLTMCPSCQRTYGGASAAAANNNNSLSIGDKSHNYSYTSKQNGTIAC